ncbi:OmpA family protein [Geoalkalibacter ferrihydriticus]|uniref:OmpA family protein n=1 Tax=Geoalkalibacter ferrihydriticus TaxID=392333 RepID=A0A1G9S6S9_9BACT|nr:OmpA family protein [Geoalkalibacter ferrihydriticus]SDM30465.1 OmpA family protein [Geoalkalibacter ferrihydriticus]
MRYHGLFTLLMILLLCAPGFALETNDLLIESERPEAVVSLERILEEGRALVRVADADNNPILGLTEADFSVTKFGRKARITQVESFAENIDVPRHIVMILDNSDSMRQRNAVQPLLAAMDELLKIVRPIDQVHLVVFADRDPQRMGGRDLHVRIFSSNNPIELKNFVNQVFLGRLTVNTFLYEAMLAGLDIIGRMPADEPKFMVVFSDGEDLNSRYSRNDVTRAMQDLDRFETYAVDFMPGPAVDPFLKSFAARGGGKIWKAEDGTALIPIFQDVASKLQYNYVVSYMFPLEGRLAVSPTELTIEEIKTIDASPLLGHIYFAEGSSEIPQRYHRFDQQVATVLFEEQSLRGTLEKYEYVLDIIGKRLRDNPQATLTLVGTNADFGEEKGRQDLSMLRAIEVRNYLQYIWNVDPARIQVEARNLPEKPSSSRIEEGRADNRRVEIHSDHPAILDLVRSTYTSHRFDNTALIVRPLIDSFYDIADWQIRVTGGGEMLAELKGERALEEFYRLPLQVDNPGRVGTAGNIEVSMQIRDSKEQELLLDSEPVRVRYIQTSQLLAQRLDYRVQERYALILFDFDHHSIDPRNQQIVNEIATRIRDLPQADVEIVGHTDNIGSEAYNQQLSERRAKAVYDLIRNAAPDSAARIQHRGAGMIDPPYDNQSPETRAFNRTVTITLEYLARQ